MLHKLFPDNQTTAYNTLILTGSIGLGKAQPLNSPVLTENGFKPMKDLTLKDKVFGNDGELHNILGIFPQGKKKVCRVTFSDKTSTECCDEHLWTVYNIDTGNQEVLETREILANGLTNNNRYKYRIPLTKPVNFIPKYKLKLSPYTLGERFSKNPDDLKDISDCLYSTISDRTELLQGILDNIGILSEDKTAIEVANTSLNLKTTLNWLAQSLGGICESNNSKLLIKLPAYSIPFKEKYKGQNLNIQQPVRYITNIEYIEDQECQCIYIDSKDHLYLTNDFIVTHNTLVAVLAQLYLLYRMLCLKDPYEYFGLMPSDKITFSMLNITIETAKGVGWDKLQQLVQGSEWFMNHGSVNASRTAPTWQPDKHIELIFGSNNNHVIGRALFSNFTDEANFSGGNSKNVDRQKEKLKKMIAQIDARMVSRFGKGTYKPTLNIIASSKDSEQSFLDSYIETKKKNESKTVLIIDEPQWVVRNDKGSPDDPGAFYVAVGGKFLPNELLPVGADEALVQSYRDKGYTTIIKVPPIYREDFETNLEQALMDDAGLASINSTKFLSGERLIAAKVDTYENPFLKDVIEVGDGPDDHLQYANFFDLSKVSAEDKARPLFIHLDMSTGGKGKGDKTGIAGVWITGKSPSVPGQDESLSLRYRLAFSVSIKAPRGFNISFVKNQNFIKWLKAQGFNIKGVSADTFQSAPVLQELKAAGFNTSVISVDRVGSDKICTPYYYLKSAIYDRRVEIYRKCDLLTTELVNLERMSSGKIEHTEGGRYGSKDQSDGFCLDGNTEIFLLSGKHKTIRQLYEENNFKDEWVLGYNTETEMFEPCQIRNVLDNGIKNNVIKLTLDTGQELICTDDHKILARDGSYVEAKDTLGVSLMPFTHELRTMYRDRKYEYIYVPKHDLSSQGVYLHKLVAEATHGSEKAAAKERCKNNEWVVIHHANYDKLNNSPENLQYLTNKEHSLVHCQLNTSVEKRNRLSEIGKEKFAQGISPLQHLTPEQKEK